MEGILALQKLQVLTVNILKESGPPWDLVVPKSSCIQHLVITANQAPTVAVQLEKADVRFSCSGVAIVKSACVKTYGHFNMFPC